MDNVLQILQLERYGQMEKENEILKDMVNSIIQLCRKDGEYLDIVINNINLFRIFSKENDMSSYIDTLTYKINYKITMPKEHHLEIITYLIENGKTSEDIKYFIYLCIQNKNYYCLEKIIQKFPKDNVIDEIFINTTDTTIIEILIKNGVNVNNNFRGITPLIYSMFSKNLENMKLLISNKADPYINAIKGNAFDYLNILNLDTETKKKVHEILSSF